MDRPLIMRYVVVAVARAMEHRSVVILRDSTVVAAIASNTLCCYLNPVAVSDVESNVQGHV
jgi:hypothetical protein